MWSFSEILLPVRRAVSKIPYIRKPLTCPDCSAFWVGVFVSLFYSPFNFKYSVLSYIVSGLVTHFTASVLYKKIF
jgi:hypothetical protein